MLHMFALLGSDRFGLIGLRSFRLAEIRQSVFSCAHRAI